jgi:GT2 family glycosyltransferase
MADAYTFVVVPTFKEEHKVVQLLECFSRVRSDRIRIVIVNGNPGDETSRRLDGWRDKRALEIRGNPDCFWSGLVNLGLRYVLQCSEEKEFVIIMNADVEFDHDVLEPLIAKARQTANCQLAAVTIGEQRVLSSGVKVVSWSLTINRHPLAGSPPADLPADTLIPVDFLPTRCTLIPFEAVARAGLIAEVQLPHYGGDNEYTNRVRRLGYQPYIYTGACVRVDTANTGTDVFHRRVSLAKRIRSLFSIKSTANPLCRLRFVRLVYPWYAWPSAMLLYTMRSFVEVLFGGAAIRFVIRRRECGFSGS